MRGLEHVAHDLLGVVGQTLLEDRNSLALRALRFYDTFAQDAFDKNFDLPNPPATPVVTAEGLDGKIVLTWGGASQVDDSLSTYAFQGYNVWQGSSAAGPSGGRQTA